jgi:hypothetical protein
LMPISDIAVGSLVDMCLIKQGPATYLVLVAELLSAPYLGQIPFPRRSVGPALYC